MSAGTFQSIGCVCVCHWGTAYCGPIPHGIAPCPGHPNGPTPEEWNKMRESLRKAWAQVVKARESRRILSDEKEPNR